MTSPFQNNADGSREFTCTSCGTHVIQCVSDGFDFPVCSICRWFGWMLIDDIAAIGEYIEASAAWVKANGGEAAMEADERATVQLMIQTQVAKAIRAGEFEPFIPSDLDDATIREILNLEGMRR